MSFPIGVTLFSPQNPVYLPPFVIYLSPPPAKQWTVTQPNGVYSPPGDVLYFFSGANNPFIGEQPNPGGTPAITAANFQPAPYASLPALASLVGMPVVIVFDQQAYRVADGKPSGTVYAAPAGVGPLGSYATITIPAGELLLMASFGMNTPSSQSFICPASYAQRMNWQITSIGG